MHLNFLDGSYKFFDKIISTRPLNLVLVMTFSSVMLTLSILPILATINSVWPGEIANEGYSKFSLFILAVVIAPIVETFLFQFVVIEILRKWISSSIIIVLLSSGLFAISHLSSYAYGLSNFFTGAILAYTYLLAIKRKFSPFLCTTAVHSLRNVIVFVISLF